MEWDKEYLYRMYLVIFETCVPHGETSGERVLHLARSVFPQLRYDYPNVSPSLLTKIKRILKKKANKTDQEIIQESSNYLVGSYLLDLALKTSDGYFVVKDFGEHIATFEDIKQLIGILLTVVFYLTVIVIASSVLPSVAWLSPTAANAKSTSDTVVSSKSTSIGTIQLPLPTNTISETKSSLIVFSQRSIQVDSNITAVHFK
jgi:hypothetical protein